MQHEGLGNYSYLMADPLLWLTPSKLDQLRLALPSSPLQPVEGLPPFQGGLAGLITYDYVQKLESIPLNEFNEFELPDLAFGMYDVVIAFDHRRNESWLISQGLVFDQNARFQDRDEKTAATRADFFLKQLSDDATNDDRQQPSSSNGSDELKQVENLAPQFTVPGPAGLTSDFSHAAYLEAARKCIDYIFAGDVFQINLAQRLLAPATTNSVELYRRLRKCNPSTFGGFFDLANAQIISASPERFISIQDRKVETRPIKGTRPRTRIPQIDVAVSQQLLSSAKDRSENIMIVDLMRNDLSRICEDDSIEVTQLCELEKYQSVFHLVSSVQGKLRAEMDAIDALIATFPGGSITGAPKIRAMEIIAELEPTARGAYCGSMGYLSLSGNADFNILIRTITAKSGWWQVPVGGGLVAQSDPQREYEETRTKAAGMLAAIRAGQQA